VYEKIKQNWYSRYAFRKKLSKLLINFTWWVKPKDKSGTDLFEGGF
jgi:hypothetical protein